MPLSIDRMHDQRALCAPAPASSYFVTLAAQRLRTASAASDTLSSSEPDGPHDAHAMHATAASAAGTSSDGRQVGRKRNHRVADTLPASLQGICEQYGGATPHVPASLSDALAAAHALSPVLARNGRFSGDAAPDSNVTQQAPQPAGRRRMEGAAKLDAEADLPATVRPDAIARTLPPSTIAQLLDNSADFAAVYEYEEIAAPDDAPGARADEGRSGGTGAPEVEEAGAGSSSDSEDDGAADGHMKQRATRLKRTASTRKPACSDGADGDDAEAAASDDGPGRYDCIEVCHAFRCTSRTAHMHALSHHARTRSPSARSADQKVAHTKAPLLHTRRRLCKRMSACAGVPTACGRAAHVCAVVRRARASHHPAVFARLQHRGDVTQGHARVAAPLQACQQRWRGCS